MIVAIRVLGSVADKFRGCGAVGERRHDQKENYRGPGEEYDLLDNVKETAMGDTLWNEGECKVTVGHD